LSQRYKFLVCIGIIILLTSACARAATPASTTSIAAATATTPTHNGSAAYTLPPDLLRKARTLTRLRAILSLGGTAGSILILVLIGKICNKGYGTDSCCWSMYRH